MCLITARQEVEKGHLGTYEQQGTTEENLSQGEGCGPIPEVAL